MEDLLQWVGVVVALLSAGAAWGRAETKIKSLEEEQEGMEARFLLKDGFQPFADEVLRRLSRIEQKQDTQNGRSKG